MGTCLTPSCWLQRTRRSRLREQQCGIDCQSTFDFSSVLSHARDLLTLTLVRFRSTRRGLRGAGTRDDIVDRISAGALDEDDEQNGNCQQVVFESLPLLIAVPIHKETKGVVDQKD